MSFINFIEADGQEAMERDILKHFRKFNIIHLIISIIYIAFFTAVIIFCCYMEKLEPAKSSNDTFCIILIFVFLAVFEIVSILYFISSVKRLLCERLFKRDIQKYLNEHTSETRESLEEDFRYGIKIKNTEAFGSICWVCPKHIFHAHKNAVNIYSIFEINNLKWCKKTIRKAKYSYDVFFISFNNKYNKPQKLYFNQAACMDIVDTFNHNRISIKDRSEVNTP